VVHENKERDRKYRDKHVLGKEKDVVGSEN
jgi:hypothetical protein